MAEKFTKFLVNKRKIDNNHKQDRKLCKDQSLQQVNLSMMVKSNIDKSCVEQGEKQVIWYMCSGCSRHMTGDPTRFISLSYKTSGHVTYGDNNKGTIVGISKIQTPSSYVIENVLLVEGLKHNLLSTS